MIDTNKYQQRLEKKIDSFSGQFMNNTKWTKVFKILSQHADVINKCLIKNIWDDVLREVRIPAFERYAGTFHESGIKDVMTGGPLTFKAIVWLVFPRNWVVDKRMRNGKLDSYKYFQDVVQIKECLLMVGELEMEISTDKLILYGYK